MERIEHLRRRIPPELAGLRLDQALAALFPRYSRTRLKAWVTAGWVSVDSRQVRPRDRVQGGELVEIRARLEVEAPCMAQAIPLEIVYEDETILVINKAAGMVVHPAAGNRRGTLQNALLHHDPRLAALPRAGIVHRLDKDTTGLMVVARTPGAHKRLVEALSARRVGREYEALVLGVLTAGGTVEGAIGRHPVHRKRMAVVHNGKPAVTHYRVIERYRGHTRVRVRLETGRTHQIRVHMAHIRHPLVGDSVYGGRLRIPAGMCEAAAAVLRGFKRQALHAARLALAHPESGESMEWRAPLPGDMAALIRVLRADAQGG